MLLMNAIRKLNGLVWSQLAADAVNAAIALLVFHRVSRETGAQRKSEELEG